MRRKISKRGVALSAGPRHSAHARCARVFSLIRPFLEFFAKPLLSPRGSVGQLLRVEIEICNESRFEFTRDTPHRKAGALPDAFENAHLFVEEVAASNPRPAM